MLLHLRDLRFELSLKSFKIYNQVANQLIIPLEQKLKFHCHVYLLNVPQKKILLKYKF